MQSSETLTQAHLQAHTFAETTIVWTMTPDGTRQDVSPEWMAYTGQSQVQATGPGAHTAVHPEDFARNAPLILQARVDQRPYQVTARIRRHDGVYQTFLLRGAPLFTPEGEVRQWAGTLTNVTAYEEAYRQALREAEQEVEQERATLLDQEAALSQAVVQAARRAQVAEDRFQRLVDANLIGILLADQERITEANDAFLQMVGYSRGDLEAGAIHWRAMTPPEYAARDDRGIAELLECGECIPFEKEYVRKDGHRVPILIGAAILEREPLEWVCFVLDLSERKRLERAVAEQTSQLQAIFEAMTDGVVVYGPGGDIQMMNAACRALLGFDEALQRQSFEARGRILFPRHPLTRKPLATAELPGTRVLRGEALTGAQSVDVLMRRGQDRREILVNYTGAPIRDAQGRIAGAVMVSRDVTERRRLEREVAERAADLEAANVRLDEFLHITAHEARTPLTALKANLQSAHRRLQRLTTTAETPAETPGKRLVGERPGAEPGEGVSGEDLAAVRERLARAEQQVERLTRLFDDLTDASRVRTGKLEVRLAPCDLTAVVRAVVAEQRRVTGRTIRWRAPSGSPGAAPGVTVQADATRIEQVLTNYVTNAAKYSASGTPIEVTLTSTPDGYARVTVRDRGVGLTPAQQRAVWERFQQSGDVQSEDMVKASAGLGLGLYISRGLIESHGGAVGVDSVVGGGSTFWFTLPLTSSIPAIPGTTATTE